MSTKNIKMKHIEWNEYENKQFQAERNLSFEAIIAAIEQRKLIGIVPNPRAHHPSSSKGTHC